METIFYRCPVCGNIMLRVSGAGNTPHCCGRPMERLEAGTADGKTEYHVPVVKSEKDGVMTICVGQSPHPMTEQHYIQWIYLATEHGGQIRYLKPGAEASGSQCGSSGSQCGPTATFRVVDKPVAVYAYCNLHSLWKQVIAP